MKQPLTFFSAQLQNTIPVPILFALIISGGLLACTNKENASEKQQAEVETIRHEFAAPIEKAHNMTAWKQKNALKTDIHVTFGGQTAMKGTLIVEAGGPGIRLEMGDNTVAVFDGQQTWVFPSDSAINPFNVQTWAYFLKAPYKLNDPGTNIEPKGATQMNGRMYNTAKLTFASSTGDTPDDWYMLYRDQESNQLHAMAYIVTAGKTVEEANKEPHAITYDNVEMMDGIPVSTTWNFWGWSEENGFSDQPIGEASLNNTQFVQKGNLFKKPGGAVPIKK
jgi:hypothetical protein